ncbi:MAG: hypothetical protein AB3K77_13725 [Methanosarcinaceae archaeon]
METPKINVKIKALDINGGVKTCLNGKVLLGPNWEASSRETLKPGVFVIGDEFDNAMSLEIEQEGLDSGKTLKITGIIDDLKFSGEIEGGVKEQTVSTRPEKAIDKFCCKKGDIVWKIAYSEEKGDSEEKPEEKDDSEESLEEAGDSKEITEKVEDPEEIEEEIAITVETIPVEIYWIFGQPGTMFKRGTWVELLEFLSGEVISTPASKEECISGVVDYFHFKHELKYDSFCGASHYGVFEHGGFFNLKAYLTGSVPIANCYDQAAALQAILGGIGINDIEWLFLEPFGYLNKTDLLGRGECNNPFFLKHGHHDLEVVDEDSVLRTGFANHAFCGLLNKDNIIDICAGPHPGNDTAEEYVGKAVDSNLKLYPAARFDRPGKKEDIVIGYGVADVERIEAANPLPFSPESAKDEKMDKKKAEKLNKIKELLDYPTKYESLDPYTFVCCNWPDPLANPLLSGWTMDLEQVRVGWKGVLKQWCMHDGEERINIEIYVSNSGPAPVHERIFKTLAATALNECVHRPNPESERHISRVQGLNPENKRHITLTASTENYSQQLSAIYNVSFNVEGFNLETDITQDLLDWLENLALNGVTEDWDKFPKLKLIEPAFPANVALGETFTCRTDPEINENKSPFLEFFTSNKNVSLEEESDLTFTFKALIPEYTPIGLVLTDRETLLSTSKEVGINIYDPEA